MNIGILGDLEFGRADIAWANLYIQRHRLSFMSFTEWYTMDRHCFMVPIPKPYSQVLALLRPLDMPTWLASIIVILFGIGFFFLLYKLDKRFEIQNHNIRKLEKYERNRVLELLYFKEYNELSRRLPVKSVGFIRDF